MADKKISQLTGAATPLGGTEVVPVVQSGSTVKATVNDFTNGRALTPSTIDVAGPGYFGAANSIDLKEDSSRGQVWLYQNATRTKAVILANNNGSGTVGIIANEPFSIMTNNLNRLTALAAGDVKVETGNLVIGTAGKGIDFSADGQAAGMTSELLDDYEEGTWTPTTASDATGAFSAQGGKYTKVGNVVTVYGAFNVSTNFTSALVGGLPFTPSPNLAVSSIYSAVQAATNTGAVQATLNNTTDITFAAAPDTTADVYRFSFSYIAA